MILVRRQHGAFYFLGRESDAAAALRRLEDGFPGRPVEVVFRRQGHVIARVGPSVEQTGREVWHPEFAAVDLEVPAEERLHP
jgi:hypothetical protein